MVDEWRLPSSVTWHLTASPTGAMNSIRVQTPLMFLLLTERWVADAVPTTAARMAAALAHTRAVRMALDINYLQ
jgi:hypothetical protein